LDKIYLGQTDLGVANDPEKLPLRSHRVRGVREEVELKRPSEYAIPEELQTLLNENSVLMTSFEALTPGRRKSYIFHIATAKQANTRTARAERCVPMILSGRGFKELEP
jgi:uncharacterized protein YdeI (YjbR/CyaY-like superfamily)